MPLRLSRRHADDLPNGRYAHDARWGQFSRVKIHGCTPACGLCGESFRIQQEKAAHLVKAHKAWVDSVERDGEALYSWVRE